ncbi:MAG TPA: sugar phosphate isomerase/epimerase [Bacilli bacterium]|nr:sugar phosphate isomerase/epimerase [Bacilli bacterium]
MFNLAVRGHDMSNVKTPAELAQRTRKHGVKNLQLALNQSFPQLSSSATMNPGLGTYFKQEMAREEVQIALLSCYSNLVHPDAREREKILQKFENYLFHARFFQASMVASETGSIIPEMGYSEDNFSDEIFIDLISVIRRLVLSGEKVGTLVGIEGGRNHPLYSNERIQQLLQAIDSEFLGIIYDPTNLITSETYTDVVTLVKQAFETFGNKIVCLHLKDFIIEKDKIIPVSLGEGVIPYKEILQIVHSFRPFCYIVLEETKDEKIARAVNLIKNLN